MITATPPPAAAARKVLRVNTGTYPDVIDPQKSSFVNEIGHLQMIYEGLTKLNEKLETVPGSAEKWTYNEDASELTFNLTQGLKYSDGTPLNAARFKYSIKRNINPATAGEYAQITDEIKGAPNGAACGGCQGRRRRRPWTPRGVTTKASRSSSADGKTACDGRHRTRMPTAPS